MSEIQEEARDERASVEFWQKPPHNCTPREAQAQVEKFKANHEEQNAVPQDVTA